MNSTLLLFIAGIIIILSLILTITIVPRRQQNRELDKGIAVTTKHPVIANPIYIAYGVFVAIIILAIAYYYFFT